jgi:hypothetical protein
MASIVIDLDTATEAVVARLAALRGVSAEQFALAALKNSVCEAEEDEDDGYVSPALAREIEEARRDVEAGRVYTSDQMREFLGIRKSA